MLKIKLILFYIVGFLVNISIFVTLFNINIGIDTFFYKGLVITFLSLILQIFFLALINKNKHFLLNKVHIALAGSLSLTFTLLLHTLILTSLDRAISVYFISMMNENNSGLSTVEIKDKFYDEYFESDKAIERRITEQIITGNIQKIDDEYVITKRGENIFIFFKYLSKTFNIKNNYVPEYNF